MSFSSPLKTLMSFCRFFLKTVVEDSRSSQITLLNMRCWLKDGNMRKNWSIKKLKEDLTGSFLQFLQRSSKTYVRETQGIGHLVYHGRKVCSAIVRRHKESRYLQKNGTISSWNILVPISCIKSIRIGFSAVFRIILKESWITMTFHGILCWHTITALVW